MRYIFLSTIFSVVFAYEKDMTFTVQAGKTDCFYHKVLSGEVIDLEYQCPSEMNVDITKVVVNDPQCNVIDATHGELDITFQLSDPSGRTIVTDYKKSENAHRHTPGADGDYKFCFDNSFSTFSEKTVFFDLLVDNESAADKDYDDDREVEIGNSVEAYIMKVRDISESVNRVRDNISTARRLQEQLSAHEARDRNLAEDMCYRVMNRSIWQIVFMVIVSVIQVFVLRSLFEDQHGLTKLLPSPWSR